MYSKLIKGQKNFPELIDFHFQELLTKYFNEVIQI